MKPKAIAKEMIQTIQILIWRFGKKRNRSQFRTVHILLVNKKEYIKISRVCVYSFLFHFPNSKLILHTDDKLEKKVARIYKNLIKLGKIEIAKDLSNDWPWQKSKLNTILKLNGTSDFYMDVDLKWNHNVTFPRKPFFFVKEFSFSEIEEFNLLNDFIKKHKDINMFMCNTSVFSFNDILFSENIVNEIRQFFDELRNIISDLETDSKKSENLIRLSEQIAMSLLYSIKPQEFDFLKIKDDRLDGSSVESAYFGATGLGF